MTHTEDLIHRLRDTASRGISSWGDLQQEAADELETQDLFVEVLKKRLSAVQGLAKNDAILLLNLAEQLSAAKLATELAVAAEREACADVCESVPWSDWFRTDIAKAIRARGQA